MHYCSVVWLNLFVMLQYYCNPYFLHVSQIAVITADHVVSRYSQYSNFIDINLSGILILKIVIWNFMAIVIAARDVKTKELCM